MSMASPHFLASTSHPNPRNWGWCRRQGVHKTLRLSRLPYPRLDNPRTPIFLQPSWPPPAPPLLPSVQCPHSLEIPRPVSMEP